MGLTERFRDKTEKTPPPLTEEDYRAIEVVVKRIPRDAVGPAIRRLRERAGWTQRRVAQTFKRQPSAVTNWEMGSKTPPVSMTGSLLKAFGIERQVWLKYVTGDAADVDLESRAYEDVDVVAVEWEFFRETRQNVLNAVYARAVEGSAVDSKLYMDWCQRNQQEWQARESKPERIAAGAVAGAWVDGSVGVGRMGLEPFAGRAGELPAAEGSGGGPEEVWEGVKVRYDSG